MATHCHGTIQSQIHFATGGVGVNPPQTSLQLVGWESISCKTVLRKGQFLCTKRYVFIQIIDSELTGCETFWQRIDPNPTVCKMDLGLIGSMARSSHELSSFVYTHQARMHLPTPIHKSRPLIGRNRKKRVTHGVSWKCKQSKTAADRRTGVLGDAGGGRGGNTGC